VPSSIEVSAGDQNITSAALSQTGYNIWGDTTWYPFSIDLSNTEPLPTAMSVDIGSNNQWVLWTDYFFVPSQSGYLDASTENGYTITAAVRSEVATGAVSAKVSYPTSQMGTLAPRIQSLNIALEKAADGLNNGYFLYSAALSLDRDTVKMATVDISVEGNNYVDEYNSLWAAIS
jgi:hypothetical protein